MSDPSTEVASNIRSRKARLQHISAQLSNGEIWWRDHQQWLQEKGYMLRPRYRPGWIPSWEGKPDMDPLSCEDGILQSRDSLLDATRISDGQVVKLKRVNDVTHRNELEVNRLFSSEPLVSHPRNHCVPVWDFLDVPGERYIHIIVMPLLQKFNHPPFEAVGEAVEFFRQILEGLQFMHQCHVAHRDTMDLNIMMEAAPLFPKLFHPQDTFCTADGRDLAEAKYSRTEHPVKYYLIDFGLSGIYDPYKGHTSALPVLSGDKTVPEYQNNMDRAQEVYPTDVYYIGNMIRESFLQKCTNLEFMQALIDDMVQTDPKKRPTMDEVVRRMSEIQRQIPWRTLRSRLTKEGGWVKSAKHVLRTIGYMATFRPAIPSPSR
ncbi:hypothetical protein EIP86_008788 [Pleurotus ostreatoroseus]|nr:hypothetical protein EIP86_008788 [Pleurotus ostreatoroseus]